MIAVAALGRQSPGHQGVIRAHVADQARAGHCGPDRRRDIRLAEPHLQLSWRVLTSPNERGSGEQNQHHTQSQYSSHCNLRSRTQTLRANLSDVGSWLQATYSIRFNRHRTGHLFQGYYKAHLVEADGYARELIKYIHLNPVRPKEKRRPV